MYWHEPGPFRFSSAITPHGCVRAIKTPRGLGAGRGVKKRKKN